MLTMTTLSLLKVNMVPSVVWVCLNVLQTSATNGGQLMRCVRAAALHSAAGTACNATALTTLANRCSNNHMYTHVMSQGMPNEYIAALDEDVKGPGDGGPAFSQARFSTYSEAPHSGYVHGLKLLGVLRISRLDRR